MSADRPISKADVALLLASALGPDKSDDVVSTAARSLGIPRGPFTGDEIRSIFELLVKAEGLVGVVARVAVTRGDVETLVKRAAERIEPPPVGHPPFDIAKGSRPAPARATSPIVDLMPLLAPALGAEKALDAIEAAGARCGVDIAAGLSMSGALAVLDEMAHVEGIVGVVARFAKARFLITS